MKNYRTKELYDYWDSVRGTRPAPRRLEIEPGSISSLLPYVFVLERLDPASYRFRLAGTHVCAYFGTELRGRQFTGLWPAKERDAVESLLYSVTEDAAGAVAGLEGREQGGRLARFELLLLPLSTRLNRYDRVIGSMNPIEAPYWLGNWPITAITMRSVRLLWPNGQPDFLTQPDEVAAAGRAGGGTPPGLRVIEGGLSGR